MTTVADARPATTGGRRLSRPVAFAAIAAILVTFAAASAAPSPLYVVYQQLFKFSAITLTLIFGVYVVGLIGALLTLGALSDHIGRRPVLAAAIALEAVSLVLFITAGDVTSLLIARLLQGIATGAAFTTLGATLVDLNPPHSPGRAGLINGIAPTTGLSIGALGCGFLVQFGPAPTHLIWGLLLAAMILAGIALARIPETSSRKPGAAASLTPKAKVPSHLRANFLALVPIIVASWAIAGLYLSLGPSVAASVFNLTNHVIGGLVVTLLCATAAVTSFALRKARPQVVLALAGTFLTIGGLVGVVGVEVSSIWVATIGAVLSGIGFGASALAQFGAVAGMAAPHERGELLAVALVVAYVAFSIPAVIAGFADTSFGLHSTALIYGLAVAALSALALVAQGLRQRATKQLAA
jgi:MFS family permease